MEDLRKCAEMCQIIAFMLWNVITGFPFICNQHDQDSKMANIPNLHYPSMCLLKIPNCAGPVET